MDMTMEKRRSRLEKWLNTIAEDVTEAITNQDIFREVQDIIRNNPQLQKRPSAFYQWMLSTFVHPSALAVRRQVDRGKDSVSLRKFLLEVYEHSDLISFNYHRSLYGRLTKELGDDLARRMYDKHVGKNSTELDRGKVQQEIDELLAKSKTIHHYADRIIAHYDARGLCGEPVPTFLELEACLGFLQELVLKYLLLLKGGAPRSLSASLTYDWKAIFRMPWLA
jgi:hypothetical protein